jgi:hypothetical protein
MEIQCKKCEKNGTVLQHGTVLQQTGTAFDVFYSTWLLMVSVPLYNLLMVSEKMRVDSVFNQKQLSAFSQNL